MDRNLIGHWEPSWGGATLQISDDRTFALADARAGVSARGTWDTNGLFGRSVVFRIVEPATSAGTKKYAYTLGTHQSSRHATLEFGSKDGSPFDRKWFRGD
jgi:hypothetical protein